MSFLRTELTIRAVTNLMVSESQINIASGSCQKCNEIINLKTITVSRNLKSKI